jgi:Golgi phosphoprotein 3 (GPP34)
MTGTELVAQLSGTGRLADDLYLMAHNDVTGRPYLQPRATGLGLAGALLAELMLAGQIQAWPQGIVVTAAARPAEWLAGRLLSHVVGERVQYATGEWLAFLARTAAQDVAARLEHAGYLARVPSRRPWRGERWVPLDSDCAFVPFTRARAALDPSRPLTATGAALAGLAAACGLGSRLLSYAAPGSSRTPEDAVRALPRALQDLIAQTRAAVDSAVLAQRA